MNYGSRLVNAICFLAICAGIVLSPVYGLWLVGGMIADRLEKRR